LGCFEEGADLIGNPEQPKRRSIMLLAMLPFFSALGVFLMKTWWMKTWW
jgi:hypothetical protein